MGHASLVARFDTVVAVMTKDEARECITGIHAHLNTARAEYVRLYEGRGWESLGYESWQACVQSEFGGSRTRVYELLNAALIDRELSAIADNSPIPEGQLRPLSVFVDMPRGPGAESRPVQIDGDAIRQTWDRAQAIAHDEGKPLVARHVTQAVEERTAPPPKPEPQPAPAPMAVHYSSATPEWYTPESVINRVVQTFGRIDLDPCSNAKGDAANVPAREHFTAADNGLLRPWWGKVYMNPPYGDEIGAWVARLLEQYTSETIDAAITLLPARVDTQWFAPLWDYPMCFVRGRLKFSGADNSAPFPSVVVYMGMDAPAFERAFHGLGRCGILMTTGE